MWLAPNEFSWTQLFLPPKILNNDVTKPTDALRCLHAMIRGKQVKTQPRCFTYECLPQKTSTLLAKMLVNIPSKSEPWIVRFLEYPSGSLQKHRYGNWIFNKRGVTIEWLITQNFFSPWNTPRLGGGNSNSFFNFTPTWGRCLIWLIFLRWVVQPPPRWGLLFVFFFCQYDEVTNC